MEDVNTFLSNFDSKSNNVIEDYILQVIGLKKKLNDFKYLVNAYIETYNKYGDNQANKALREYIINGVTKYITNNNARNNLSNLNFDNIYNILKNGLNIDFFVL